MASLYELKGKVQKYAWGKLGLESSVAQLQEFTGDEIIATEPYAELWMGTHVNGPATVEVDGGDMDLQQYLKGHPKLLSTQKADLDPQGNLCFLFKILSVNKALSIQAHPNKKLAKELHAKFPDMYKDDNHKPEMALAITEFEALVGFQSLENIETNVTSVPELGELLQSVSRTEVKSKSAKLRTLFEALMKCKPEIVKKQLAKLEKRLEGKHVEDMTTMEKLALRLSNEYPGDVGVFCAFFLNYKKLKPGQAVFLAANQPHAYLHGDCAEIMATSDNVVRAGLTPKPRDVDTLCNMLNYTEFEPAKNVLNGVNTDEFTKLYVPNDESVTEFCLERTVLPPANPDEEDDDRDTSYAPKTSSYASIILVMSGNGVAQGGDEEGLFVVEKGIILFQAAGKSISIENTSEQDELVYFRATKKGAI